MYPLIQIPTVIDYKLKIIEVTRIKNMNNAYFIALKSTIPKDPGLSIVDYNVKLVF